VILVDSSAWIEYQRATGSPADLRVNRAIETDEPLETTGLVLLEVLSGAHDESHARDLRRLLDRCRFLPLEEPSDHEAAAALYRACRRQGTTIRRLPDCLIATVAMRTNTTLLHRDADFDAIARHGPLSTLALRTDEQSA
jgi:predicted nucleic acid-binding protein